MQSKLKIDVADVNQRLAKSFWQHYAAVAHETLSEFCCKLKHKALIFSAQPSLQKVTKSSNCFAVISITVFQNDLNGLCILNERFVSLLNSSAYRGRINLSHH